MRHSDNSVGCTVRAVLHYVHTSVSNVAFYQVQVFYMLLKVTRWENHAVVCINSGLLIMLKRNQAIMVTLHFSPTLRDCAHH